MSRPSTGAVLAGLAVVLGVLAPVAGVRPPGDPGVVELTAELAGGDPLVDAVTLGEWIRDRRPVRVWDVRADSSAFIRFAIPTAAHVPFRALRDRLAGHDAPTPDSGIIVLYDDGDGSAARAWLLLRRLGYPDVRILERGVVGWIDGVVSPVLPADTPEERARYRRVAAISRYFGGLPRTGTPPARDRTGADEAVQLLSRRGCY